MTAPDSSPTALPEDTGGRQLSPVLENYLEIIFRQETSEGAARASAIAETAGVSRSTVTSALKTLKALGYVSYEPYSLIHLTETGLDVGRDIAHRHMVFQEFFEHVLQLDGRTASDVACELEHVVPPEVIRRVGQFVLYLNSRREIWEHWREEYARVSPGARHSRSSFADDPEALPPALAARLRTAAREKADDPPEASESGNRYR